MPLHVPRGRHASAPRERDALTFHSLLGEEKRAVAPTGTAFGQLFGLRTEDAVRRGLCGTWFIPGLCCVVVAIGVVGAMSTTSTYNRSKG